MSVKYMIVYPCGNRNALCVAQVSDYEKSDWDIASRQEFENSNEGEQKAKEYMIELARKNGLRYEGQRAYLD